jgi:hypothetical protein
LRRLTRREAREGDATPTNQGENTPDPKALKFTLFKIPVPEKRPPNGSFAEEPPPAVVPPLSPDPVPPPEAKLGTVPVPWPLPKFAKVPILLPVDKPPTTPVFVPEDVLWPLLVPLAPPKPPMEPKKRGLKPAPKNPDPVASVFPANKLVPISSTPLIPTWDPEAPPVARPCAVPNGDSKKPEEKPLLLNALVPEEVAVPSVPVTSADPLLVALPVLSENPEIKPPVNWSFLDPLRWRPGTLFFVEATAACRKVPQLGRHVGG